MVTIKSIVARQCPDILPVRDSEGSGIVIELRCILDLGHDGVHRDKAGSVWVNQHWLMRQRGVFE